MRTKVYLADCAGKTVEGVVKYWGTHAIHFTDGTSALLHADITEESHAELSEHPELTACDKKNLGLLSEEEYEAAYKHEQGERELRQFNLYKQLRQQFEYR